MLIPVLAKVSYRVSTSTLVVLENVIGANLPLLFPEVRVANRTGSASSVTVSASIRTLFANSPDPAFDGALLYTPFSQFSLGNGQSSAMTGLPGVLYPSSYGQTTEITLTRASGAPEALVSLVVRGLIESSVAPDPLVSINT